MSGDSIIRDIVSGNARLDQGIAGLTDDLLKMGDKELVAAVASMSQSAVGVGMLNPVVSVLAQIGLMRILELMRDRLGEALAKKEAQ